MDLTQVSIQVLLVSALVYGITDVAKNALKLESSRARGVSILVAVLLGVAAVHTGYLQGNVFEQIGMVVLTSIGGNLIHKLHPGSNPRYEEEHEEDDPDSTLSTILPR